MPSHAAHHGLKPPVAVLIDWDHTLANPNHAYIMAFEQCCALLEHENYDLHFEHPKLDAEALLRDVHRRREAYERFEEYFKKVCGEEYGAQVMAYCKDYMARYSILHTQAMQGARGLLQYLNDHRIPTAIVSNNSQLKLEGRFHGVFGDRFPNILLVGKDDPSVKKPDPASLSRAMDLLAIPPVARKGVWMVGDRYDTDIGAAKSAGCVPVWIGQDAHSHAATVKHEETIVVANLTKLYTLITRLQTTGKSL